MGQTWPRCDPAIRKWASAAIERLCDELDPNLTGAYLHGSLAGGSFYPPKSDVDLLFVVTNPMTPAARRRFAELCVDASRDRLIVGSLECSVVLAESAARPTHPMPFEVHFAEEWVADIQSDTVDYTARRRDSDLSAHCQATLEFGICLRGRPVHEVFGPVSKSDFMESVLGDLEWILEGENLVSSPVYGVLNYCRVLWVWSGHSHRLVPTKDEAGTWAIDRLPTAQRGVVEKALAAYRDDTVVPAEHRQTVGRPWDELSLLEFRNYMRDVWTSR